MISALVLVADPGDADALDRLADSLGALVAGVAAGLVGDAVIVAAAMDPGVDTIADATGASLVVMPPGANPWVAGAALARRDWVLCLEAGDVPGDGWIRTLDRFVGTAGADALGRLSRPHASLATRLAVWAEAMVGAGVARPGDVVRRDRLTEAGTFAPRLTPRRLIARIDRA
ncbi:hypothetical protein [Methylobacterium sp. WL120]|uniref:hypothetical protein n=1 Tax=Methylobacterium sp. WL120 TaxID=2603887 RepID=UPI0011C99610|nr:hypothetical protein [Methylobacterium sp. WL120]TXM57742.1 hypothetical protein FV229_25400 [Methylobacterium sp. WL120]